MAGCTALLASRATCMRPTRMWAMREVNPAWIRTTCETNFRAELGKGRPRLFWSNKISTLAVQLVWVIFPDVEMVCVKIFPSSGIHGPQMLSEIWKFDYCQLNCAYSPDKRLTPLLKWESGLNNNKFNNDQHHENESQQEVAYHVSQGTRVDIGVMNAAVFFVSIFPVIRTVVLFTKPLSCFGVHDGAKHRDTRPVDPSLTSSEPVSTNLTCVWRCGFQRPIGRTDLERSQST